MDEAQRCFERAIQCDPLDSYNLINYSLFLRCACVGCMSLMFRAWGRACLGCVVPFIDTGYESYHRESPYPRHVILCLHRRDSLYATSALCVWTNPRRENTCLLPSKSTRSADGY